MKRLRLSLVLVVLLAVVVATPVQAGMVDNLNNIAARPWTDDREPGEGGIGLLQQGCSTMLLDYGNTTDSAGIPNPDAGYDLNGNWVGHANLSGGAFNSGGGGQDEWDSGYRGKFDRVPSGPFGPVELGILTTSDVFVVDMYKSQMGSEHARSLQIYDGTGARSTYHIQSEGGADPPAVPGETKWGSTIGNTPAGWSTMCIPINAANVDEEENADLTNIRTIKVWCSSWAALASELNNPYPEGDPAHDCWPCWTHGDWIATMHSGGWIELDNLRLVPNETLQVQVDITPESCTNPLNVKGKGVLNVAILGGTVDVYDIDVASIELEGVSVLRSEYTDVGSPATVMVDDMDNIAARPWTDDREPGEGGCGLLQQGDGTMVLDYGNTTDSDCVPNPDAGYDLNGNWVGHASLSGGAFTDLGCCVGDYDDGYRGKFDRVPSGPFGPVELGILTTSDVFLLDEKNPLTGHGEHARSLQIYDGTGARSTYHINREGGKDEGPPGEGWGHSIENRPTGWTTKYIPLSSDNVDEEENADLTNIRTIKIWCSSWAAQSIDLCNPYDPGDEEYPCWPCWTHGDWRGTNHSGLPLELDNLRLLSEGCPQGGDGITDLVVKFDRQAVSQTLSAVHKGEVVPLTLTGLLNCQSIEGVDSVVIAGKPDPADHPGKP